MRKNMIDFHSFINEKMLEKLEDGLMVYPSTKEDGEKLKEWIEESEYYAEWNSEGNFWLFKEDEENYDNLEFDLNKEFVENNIDVRFEGV